MASLLVKVRKKMSITAHRKVLQILEGEYSSVYKGRSLDFDDLREYSQGDDIKDIDWKATARVGQMLIKRYIAERKYNFLFVVDTGRSMAATAPSGEVKKDVAVMAAGVIASVAQQHGDLVGLVAGDSTRLKYMPLKDSRPHVERVLQYIDTNCSLESASSNLAGLLDYVRRTVKRRTMLIIVSDTLQFAQAEEQLLRRLGAQHELMFIAIDDLDPNTEYWSKQQVYDVEQDTLLPSYIRSQKEVEDEFNAFLQQQSYNSTKLLERLSISNVRIDSEAKVVAQIIRLLEKQKHAKR